MRQRRLTVLPVVSLIAACIACGSPASAQVTVELRGGAPDRAASAVTALDQGLEVRFGEPGKPETREVIPWDEVRGISDPSSRNAAACSCAFAIHVPEAASCFLDRASAGQPCAHAGS